MSELLDITQDKKTRSSDPDDRKDLVPGMTDREESEDYVVTAAKGSGIMTFGKLFEYVGRFAIAFLLARVLGAEQFGLYSLALSAAAILSTVSLLGMDDAVLRNVAVSRSREDEQSLWGYLQLTFGITFLLSVISGFVLYFFAEPIAEIIFSEPTLTPMLRLAAIIIPVVTLSEMLLYATQGFKRMEYGVIAKDFVQIPFRLVLLGILALINLNAFTAMMTFGIADLTSSFILVYFLNKEFPLKRSLSDSRRDLKELLSFSFPFWFSDILNTVRNNIQVMMLGSLSTITSAGIFTIVNRVNLVGIITYRSVQTSIRPIIAELQSKDKWQDVERLYQTSTRWGLLVNIPMTVILVLFSGEILLLFGESFVEGGLALSLLALSEFVKVLTGMSGTIIDMSGLNRVKLFNSIIQVTLAVGINVYLIPRWGLMGAAVAVLITVSVMNLLRMVEVFVVYKIHPFNRILFKPFTAGFAALIVVLILGNLIDVERNLVTLVIGVAVVLAIYVGVLRILGLPEDDRRVIRRTINRIKKSASEVMIFINQRRKFNSG